VHVSAAAARPVTPTPRHRRLPGAGPLAVDFAREVLAQGCVPLAITLAHGQDAGEPLGPHRDAFDRMLIAQPRREHMALVSNEAVFDGYGLTRLW
jgi:PIN domain nuclease of toxin-antitoxin system